MRLVTCLPRTFFLLGLLAVLPAITLLAKPEWDPIPPADLAATECKAFPGSTAEALLISQTLNASHLDSWTTQYNRIKIYSPKGAEERGVMNIDYSEEHRVWDLAARVTKPDGHSTEYHNDSFTDSVFAKVDGYKFKRKTLAVPNLDAGDIVELKWSQSTSNEVGNYFWWYSQLTVPVRLYTFAMKGSRTDYRVLWFNVPTAESKKINNHEIQLEMRNLPPFDEEKAMAPMRDVRGWFLVLFTSNYLRWFDKDPTALWQEISGYYAEDFSLLTKPNSTLKTTATEAIRGATSDEEKLSRLYDFCQQHVSNLDYFDSADLQKAKKKIDDRQSPQTPETTLKSAAGYSHHVNELFASLARSAGFDARVARSASRNATLQVRNATGWIFLSDDLVAVRLGKDWHFYAPGDYYVPAGMLDQTNEGATSLICDEDKVIYEQNPVSPAQKSPVRRQGHFTLDLDGNLEGDVEITMEGRSGLVFKKAWRTWQPADIDTEYRKIISKRLPAAVISDLVWENFSGNKLPLVVRYHLKVPAYADVAGTKIILTPGVFEHGEPAFFTSDQRQYPIFFDYAWSGHDEIQFTLPEGYTLDAATAPANVGDPTAILGVRYEISYKGKARLLTYKRNFALGANGVIALQTASYPALKQLFDAISRSDEHTILLKPAPVPAAPAVPAPAAPPQSGSATEPPK